MATTAQYLIAYRRELIDGGMPPDAVADLVRDAAHLDVASRGLRINHAEAGTAQPAVRQPTIGRIVHYRLSQYDADAINKRRADFQAFRSNFSGPSDPGQAGADGHLAHVGNHATAGDYLPAMIVSTFDGPAANLQVHLDGNDLYWATSCTEGSQPGQWIWPLRVEN